jgi:hypothetical protein
MTWQERRALINRPFPVIRLMTTSYPHGGTQKPDMTTLSILAMYDASDSRNRTLVSSMADLELEVFGGERI